MLWSATLLVLSALFAIVASFAGGNTNESLPVRRLRRYKEDLSAGLPEEVKKSVLDKLEALPHEQVERLYTVCCPKRGQCAVDTAAFLVLEYKRFDPEDTDVDFDVGMFAKYCKHHFLEYVKKLEDVPLDLSHPEQLDEIALLAAFGKWFKNAGYKIESDKALVEIPAFAIFFKDDLNRQELNAKFLLCAAGRPNSKVLFNYWAKQSLDNQWRVYLNFLYDRKYGVLTILQPLIFGTNFQAGKCTEEDYVTAFRKYSDAMATFGVLKFFPKYLPNHLFSALVKVFREMTGSVTADLGPDGRNLLEAFTGQLPTSLTRRIATFLPSAPKEHLDYVLLKANNRETWRIFENQLFVHLGPKCVELMEHYPYFAPARTAKYIEGQYESLSEYSKLYDSAVKKVLARAFGTHLKMFIICVKRLMPGLSASVFWHFVDFIDGNAEYSGCVSFIGMMIADVSTRGTVGALIQKLLDCPDDVTRHRTFHEHVEQFIEQRVGRKHPYFQERFGPVREQIRSGLSEMSRSVSPARYGLDMYILSIVTEERTPNGLHDLQVAVTVDEIGSVCNLASEKLTEIFGAYDSAQLKIVYKEGRSVTFGIILEQSQLRERFSFDRFFKDSEREVFCQLSQLYQHAFPGRRSIFGLILKYLGASLEAVDLGGADSYIILFIHRLVNNLDFSGNSDGCWLALERHLYKSLNLSSRHALVTKFGRQLGVNRLNLHILDAEYCTTLDEAFEVAEKRSNILTRCEEQLVKGLSSQEREYVLRALDTLDVEELEELYSTCCPGNHCLDGAALFLVGEGKYRGPELCARVSWRTPDFVNHLQSLGCTLPQEGELGHLDRTAFLRGLGVWRIDGTVLAGHKAFQYVVLLDDSELGKKARAEAVLTAAWGPKPAALLDYWMEQEPSRQLAVYRNARRNGGFGYLAIMQPLLFADMSCIQSFSCSGDDYLAAFKSHVKALPGSDAVPRPPFDDESLSLYFIADAITEGLMTEGAQPTYVILDPSKPETWRALEQAIVRKKSESTVGGKNTLKPLTQSGPSASLPGTRSVSPRRSTFSTSSGSFTPSAPYTPSTPSTPSQPTPSSPGPSQAPSPVLKPQKPTEPKPTKAGPWQNLDLWTLAKIGIGSTIVVLGSVAAYYYLLPLLTHSSGGVPAVAK